MGNSKSKKAIEVAPLGRDSAQPNLQQGTSHANVGNAANELNIHGTQIVYIGSQSRKPKAPQDLYKFPLGSPYFHGRIDKRIEIEEAIKKCREGDNSYARSLVITGLEGMGKSEILKILAAKWQDQYGFVYWLDAQSEPNLNAQFHELYTILISQSHGNDDRPPIKSVYYALAEKYEGNGIFIFDNAEYLTTEKGVFGIGKYLEPEFHCKKPIFVITCRDPTPFEKENITCLPALDRLTSEESYNCLIQYLDLIPEHAKKLPETLQKEVKKLADLVEGHPLGLSLIGNAIAKAKKVALEENKLKVRVKSVLGFTSNQKKSFDDINSDVKRYIDALTNDPSLTKSYEDKLESILSWTMERLGEEGKVSKELLSIVAHLSPDNIYVNLVQSIFLGMDFVPGEKFFFKTNADYEPFVRSQSGLVALETNNIIKFEAKEYTITNGHLVEYIMIRMHRRLHEIVRTKPATSEGPLLKITKFFERTSSVNVEFREHLSFILTNYVKGEIQLEISSVLMLSLQLGKQNLFLEVRDKIRSDPLLDAKDEKIVIKLLDELFQVDFVEPNQESSSHTDIANSVYKLSSDFATKYWVIEMCIYLMRHISKKYSEDNPKSNFSDWVIKNYMECQQTKRRYCDVITIVYLCDITRDCTQDGEFVWKVFACTADHQRWRFWRDMEIICRSDKLDQSKRKNILRHLFRPSESDLFTQYLVQISTTNDTRKLFLEDWCIYFTACVKELVKDSELAKGFSKLLTFLSAGISEFVGGTSNRDIMTSRENEKNLPGRFTKIRPLPNTFHNAFLELTCLITRDIESAYDTADTEKEVQDQWETGLVNLIETWCKLFSIDTDLYNNVQETLDAAIESWLKARRESPREKYAIYGFGHYINEWSASTSCSSQTNKWIKELSSKLFAKLTPSNEVEDK